MHYVNTNQSKIIPDTKNYLKDWGRIMEDKFNNNQVQEIMKVNMPDKIKEAGDQRCSLYVYAAYLPPGLHGFLIYCPVTKRVFCKDIVVNLNTKDMFPEFPVTLQLSGIKLKKSR